MQDNKNIANIDEQFTDLGWEKMQGVLDKEMPVAPVRKPSWGWLWLLLLFGVMIVGTYFNFAIKNNTIKPNEISNTNHIEVADVIENTNDISEFEENNEAKFSRTDDFSRRTESNNLTAKVVSTDVPKIAPKKELEADTIQNNLYIKKENNFIDKNNTKQDIFIIESKVENSSIEKTTNTFEVPVISEKEPIKSTVPPLSVLTENQTRNSLVSTERIATLSPQILASKNFKNNELSAFDPIPKPRQFSQTYSAFAGVRSDEFSRFGGFNMGLLAHYRFTPKVGLETGLMYSNTRKNIRANIDYTNAVNELDPDNMLEYRSNIEDVHSYNYFRLPLSLTYRPRHKIQLGIGLNAGYRFDNITGNNTNEDISVPNDIGIDSNYDSQIEVNIPVNDPSMLDGTLAPITVPYSLAVRRIDMAAQAGVRYYPTPRLGIDLNYQYGLLNMTPNTNINRNSGLQLALVWQLHR